MCAFKSAGMCADEEGIGETVCVVSLGSSGGGVDVVGSWVVVVEEAGGVRSAIRCCVGRLSGSWNGTFGSVGP